MSRRLTSAIVTILVHGVLGYALFMILAMSMTRREPTTTTLIDVASKSTPPAPRKSPPPSASVQLPAVTPTKPLQDWATASPRQRDLAFMATTKWVQDNLSEEEKRLARWRANLPQGSGPARVTRLRPPNLTTHTIYWPAAWSKGPLPIIAWGNGFEGNCTNSSLPYAAFLSEIASHGYFIVAVGNDDIDYPQPEGLAFLADGRPLRTEASALTKAVDWAIAENGRAGSPHAGKLNTQKIAYMGHGCGGQQAIAAAADRRATTAIALNAAASFSPEASREPKVPIAYFAGGLDNSSVLETGDSNFAKAQAAGWPMYKAALEGMNHAGAYVGPDRRWTKAIIAWLNWQLKGDQKAATLLTGLQRDSWKRVGSTGL